MSLVAPVLGYIYYPHNGNAIPTNTQSAVKGSISVGVLLGQLIFGLLGDSLGRKAVYGKELLITMFGTLMVIVVPTYIAPNAVMAWICVFRVVTGIGIGGGMY